MIVELKPEQQKVLETAIQRGGIQEEILDRAFEIIRAEQEVDDWMLANRDEIAVKLERAFEQSERGEVMDGEEAVQMLQERHARQRTA
jgi:pimeloyl-CoA synthetase